MLNELALFAGAGGGILVSQLLGHRVVGAIEIDPYCREIMLRRQEEGHLSAFPIWDDVRTFDGQPWRGAVDIVSGGFPCQPFSLAGKQRGAEDERNLWPETIRIVREVRPRFAFLENVASLITSGYFGTILGDLAESGYDCRWRTLSATEVGAPHIRDRVWILAYTPSERGEQTERPQLATVGINASDQGEGRMAHPAGEQDRRSVESGVQTDACSGRDLPHAEGLQREGIERSEQDRVLSSDARSNLGYPAGPGQSDHKGGPALEDRTGRGAACLTSWWDRDPADPGPGGAEPVMGRVAHGVDYRVDRLTALGNGQVPAVAALAWRILSDGL